MVRHTGDRDGGGRDLPLLDAQVIRAVGVRDGHTVRLDVHGVRAQVGLHLYIIWYGHGAQVDALIDIPVNADDGGLPRLPMTAQQQKGAAAQNCERGEQKDPKLRLFHHVLIVGCPAGVVNGFLTWYNSLIFYRFL